MGTKFLTIWGILMNKGILYLARSYQCTVYKFVGSNFIFLAVHSRHLPADDMSVSPASWREFGKGERRLKFKFSAKPSSWKAWGQLQNFLWRV